MSTALIEPYTREYFANPYPTLAQLRETSPVHKIRLFGFAEAWLVSRYDLGRTVLMSEDFRKSLPGRQNPLLPPAPGPVTLTLDSDPPEHSRLRRLAQAGFTPRYLERLRDDIEHTAGRLVDGLAGRGEANLIRDLAVPLSLRTINLIMGVPPEDEDDVRERVGALTKHEGDAEDLMERNMRAVKAIREYYVGLIARKREQPGDDVTSALLSASDGGRLTEDELIAMAMFLLFSGYITSVNFMAAGIRTLLDHPDQLAELRADPGLVRGAVEECLRYESPFLGISRVAGDDLELGGVALAKGDAVIVAVNGVNRDPDVFADPDRFDITRDPNPHLAFGRGIHHCIGAPLVKMQGKAVFERLFGRLPDMVPEQEVAEWGSDGVLRGVAGLTVRFTPRAAA